MDLRIPLERGHVSKDFRSDPTVLAEEISRSQPHTFYVYFFISNLCREKFGHYFQYTQSLSVKMYNFLLTNHGFENTIGKRRCQQRF